ncbi:UNVERIFIED_CONTAM: transposase-like zinc-binding protein [Acetivibrio alkalicellulosi]
MIEIADILNLHADEYIKEKKLPYHVQRAIDDIRKCRTEKNGVHISECDHCGYSQIDYNSCRNRHCPKCQWQAREEWVEKRKQELLPVEYYHVVFTVPEQLNSIFLKNQSVMYNMLFKATSETLITLSKDPKWIGGEIGFISILHTWGQNLSFHPHIHNIVTGGGLSEDKNKWLSCRKGFFIRVEVMSSMFKKKFIDTFERAYHGGKLKFYGDIKEYENPKIFYELILTLRNKDWVIYSKPPFGGPEKVLEYIGRYTHRVAISNSRIKSFENGKVTFSWRDYKDDNKKKDMTLESKEFIKRFLLHILPKGMVKIRYYGIWGNNNKNEKLKICQELLNDKVTNKYLVNKKEEEKRLNENICKCCAEGSMVVKRVIRCKKHPPFKKPLKVA